MREADGACVRTLDNALFHGVAWYPELWPDRLDEDLRLMREAGMIWCSGWGLGCRPAAPGSWGR
jgi:hypothetical protein